MWTKEMFGMDFYHILSAFIIYSILGWCVESIYMSICNRKLTNRGFAFGPFCPIYGFGAVIGYILLSPLSDNVILLYVTGAVVATLFEFLVGRLMIRLFGELWWDYNEKPYNYKGIICLESTVAWGAYAVIIILFLHSFIMNFIDRYPSNYGILACKIIMALVTVDYMYHLLAAFGVNVKEYKERVVDKYHSFKARWY